MWSDRHVSRVVFNGAMAIVVCCCCVVAPVQALESSSSEGALPASGRSQVEEMRPHAGEAAHPELEAVLVFDVFHNAAGGAQQGTVAQSRMDLIFELSTQERGWWPNGNFRASLMARSGGHSSAMAGDAQILSNIDAPNAVRVYDLWYQHQWLGERIRWLVGLHDYNADFNVSSYGGLFINSSFGIGPEASQVGPSIFPAPALGTRLRLSSAQGAYLMAGAYDGVPGEPGKPHGSEQSLRRNDGLFWAMEGGWVRADASAPYTKLSFGLWSQNHPQEDLQGNPKSSNRGGYVIAERAFSEQLGAFVQLGVAQPDRNPIGRYLGAGINYKGLVPSRAEDVLGLAWNQAENSDDFLALNPGLERAERVLELTYRAQLSPYIILQPDLQYIINPGMDPGLENALAVGLRLLVTPELSGLHGGG